MVNDDYWIAWSVDIATDHHFFRCGWFSTLAYFNHDDMIQYMNVFIEQIYYQEPTESGNTGP